MTWLYIPLACVQVSECSTKDLDPHPSFLELNSALSVTLKGKPLQPQRLLSTWKKESWIRRLYGLTLPPSTAQRGVEKWIASLQVSHANRTVSQATAKAQRTNDGYGTTLPESSATFLLGSFFLKTSGACFPVEGSRLSSHRWSASGSILSGEYWPRPKLEVVTSANEYSFWPTVTVCGNNNRSELSAKAGDGLATKAKSWAAPTASDYKRGDYPGDHNRKTPCIAAQVVRWATPCTMDVLPTKSQAALIREMTISRPGRSRLSNLRDQVIHNWPSREAPAVNSYSRRAQNQNIGQASSAQAHTSPLRLNPAFVCHLMGWPWFWTHPDQIKSAPQEMELFRCRLQQHLSFLLGEQE